MNSWSKVWNKKERVHDAVLAALIKADGFDTVGGDFSVHDWKEYTLFLASKLDIGINDTLYEVGCGSGAFIYPLFVAGHKVGGCDYSQPLIELAQTIIANNKFVNNQVFSTEFACTDALFLDTKEKYNIVFSHSVFQYFSSLEYAASVLDVMNSKSKSKIAIFDVNDKTKESIYHEIRAEGLTPEEYQEKYNGLEHLFYEKDWFEIFAENNNFDIEIFDQGFEKYSNSKLRFNVIMTRK